jgi:hypothetical protein
MIRPLLVLIVAVAICAGAWHDTPTAGSDDRPIAPAIYAPIGPLPALAPAVRVAPPATMLTTTTVPQAVVVVPVDGDCNSWRPLVEAAGITDWQGAVYVMRRESGCSNAHAYRRSTHDHSMGPFQINVWGNMAAAWERAGFSHDYLHTPEGAVRAAAFLWKACGWGPWTGSYSCPGGWPL